MASADARTPDIASVGRARCEVRGWSSLTSRWRTVGADKTSGCRAAAGLPRRRVSASLLLPASLFELEDPSRAPFPSLSFFQLRTPPQLPPFVTPALLRAASNCLDATPKHVPRPSSRTVRARRRKGRCDVRLYWRYRCLWEGLEDEGAVDVA